MILDVLHWLFDAWLYVIGVCLTLAVAAALTYCAVLAVLGVFGFVMTLNDECR